MMNFLLSQIFKHFDQSFELSNDFDDFTYYSAPDGSSSDDSEDSEDEFETIPSLRMA